MLSYSDNPRVNVRFGDYRSNANFNDAVDNIAKVGGSTRADRALRYAGNSMFLDARRGVPSVAILFSNGRQTGAADLEPLYRAVQHLRQKRVRVIVIGVGSSFDRNELTATVERPGDVIFANSYDELVGQAERVSMLACSIPPPISK